MEMTMTPGEKLLALLLCDLLRAPQERSEIKPDFVARAVDSGNLWALKWSYSAILYSNDIPEAVASQAMEHMRTCLVLEQAWARFPDDARAYLCRRFRHLDEAGHVFVGYDEGTELAFATASDFMINEMGLFQEFAGREQLHAERSRGPRVESYKLMSVMLRVIHERRDSADLLTWQEFEDVMDAGL